MTSERPILEIGILIREQSLLGTVHGLADLFGFADRLARQRDGTTTPALRVSRFMAGPDGVARAGEPPDIAAAEPAIVIVPPRETIALGMEEHRAAGDWLRARHEAGVVVSSICGGVFLLAQAGLLDGREVTTHWVCAGALAKDFPTISVDADQLVIDDGDVITAGGMMAWADLGLLVIDRLLGPAVMADTARFMMIDPPRRQQRFYRPFEPPRDHGDAAVAAAQERLHHEGPGGATVADMAGWARLEVRTFVRRFHRATGLRPNEYSQRLRVETARALIETSIEPIGTIAQDVGYADPASFRKVFTRVMGLSPADYRRRFGVRSGERTLAADTLSL
ncbi:helix-turn-helix domain-containing protein [Sphingomonas sp. ZT3P38]|uniref:GlxA family transcriptional regulator n=1 Tax=Parasphingomonas zepuensis TaxID=3096161 RepID=UPI002FC6D529